MHSKLVPSFAAALMLALSLLVSGCEDSSIPDADDAIRLEPAQLTFSRDSMTARLRIVNGQPPYIWRVADATMGKLTGLPADAATVPTHIAEANYERFEGAVGVNTVTVYDKRGWSATSRLTAPAPTPDP